MNREIARRLVPLEELRPMVETFDDFGYTVTVADVAVDFDITHLVVRIAWVSCCGRTLS